MHVHLYRTMDLLVVFFSLGSYRRSLPLDPSGFGGKRSQFLEAQWGRFCWENRVLEQESILLAVFLQVLEVLVQVGYRLLDRAQTSSPLPVLLDPPRYASKHADPWHTQGTHSTQATQLLDGLWWTGSLFMFPSGWTVTFHQVYNVFKYQIPAELKVIRACWQLANVSMLTRLWACYRANTWSTLSAYGHYKCKQAKVCTWSRPKGL